jgi:hypothetical protein
VWHSIIDRVVGKLVGIVSIMMMMESASGDSGESGRLGRAWTHHHGMVVVTQLDSARPRGGPVDCKKHHQKPFAVCIRDDSTCLLRKVAESGK